MSIKAVAEAVSRIDSAMYIKDLFDPIQTHAVYGVNVNLLNEVKAAIKYAGGNRFRVISSGIKDIKIVCFKVKG